MVNSANQAAYVAEYEKNIRELGEADGVKRHIGGIASFYMIGAVERRLLEIFGLKPDSYIIDIGCGSGRLAQALSGKPNLRYLGVDVVPALIEYCRRELRQDWRFEVSDNFTIPEGDGVADYVTAFSLFTHLLHEETISYMRDVARVLKPGGMLVLSFLEYQNKAHRKLFLTFEKTKHTDRPLVVFNDRYSLAFFASEVGLDVPEFFDGSDPFIVFNQSETLPDGKTVDGAKSFGQSVCVMRKPRK